MSKKEQLAQRTIKLKWLQQYNQNLPDSSDFRDFGNCPLSFVGFANFVWEPLFWVCRLWRRIPLRAMLTHRPCSGQRVNVPLPRIPQIAEFHDLGIDLGNSAETWPEQPSHHDPIHECPVAPTTALH